MHVFIPLIYQGALTENLPLFRGGGGDGYYPTPMLGSTRPTGKLLEGAVPFLLVDIFVHRGEKMRLLVLPSRGLEVEAAILSQAPSR